MGVYTVFYRSARTGRRLAAMDTDCGEIYLDNLARMQTQDDDIAVAVRADQQVPHLYLMPGSHEWTEQVPPVLAPGTPANPIRWERVAVTAHAETTTERHGVRVAWTEVARVLGHDHQGMPLDDEALVRALLVAGAPAWVRGAKGWTDERGWGLVGPVRP